MPAAAGGLDTSSSSATRKATPQPSGNAPRRYPVIYADACHGKTGSIGQNDINCSEI
jgi:hypothetical protein